MFKVWKKYTIRGYDVIKHTILHNWQYSVIDYVIIFYSGNVFNYINS